MSSAQSEPGAGAARRWPAKAAAVVVSWGLVAAACATEEALFTELATRVRGAGFVLGRLAFGDVDNDGWPDLLATETPWQAERVALLRNAGGHDFVESALPDLGPEVNERWKGVPVFGDIDNDGDADAFVAVGAFHAGAPHPGVLLRNDRGAFVDVTADAGLAPMPPVENAIFLDYDRDGRIDLYVGHWVVDPFTGQPLDPGARNRLYRNQGWRFTEVTAAAGLDVALSAAGGTAAGMAAADFDADGWTDLYLGVRQAANRLFLNAGDGTFRDATHGDLADPGESFGVAVGDIDNNGSLDILQAAGGGVTKGQRSLLLFNRGDADFVDITAGSGLGDVGGGEEMRAPVLADFDNDGDLDLFTGTPRALFENDGHGIFSRSGRSLGPRPGRDEIANVAALADIDRDGAMDVWLDLFDRNDLRSHGSLLRNTGNDNHWLAVDLVGVASNRDATGARVVCHTGLRRQTRVILGGRGWQLDDRVVHFGLGAHATVDSLVIAWPAGGHEVIGAIPADQMVRIVEGRGAFRTEVPMAWEPRPDPLVAGAATDWAATLRFSLLEPGATLVEARADLSAIGGPAQAPVEASGEGWVRFRERLSVPPDNGWQQVVLEVLQSTSLGTCWSRFTRDLLVVPEADLVVFGEALAAGWRVDSHVALDTLQLAGKKALSVGSAGHFTLTFTPATAVDPAGWTALRLAFHPGSATPAAQGTLVLQINAESFPLAGTAAEPERLRFDADEWQRVDIDLTAWRRSDPIRRIRLQGKVEGEFYLADLRLVVLPTNPVTAVLGAAPERGLPSASALGPSYPNPFNGTVQIPYVLARAGAVRLAVYDLLGRRVATLVDGVQPAGAHRVRWDGRDGRGTPVASGIYLYRMRGAGEALTGRLALVR